MMKLVVSYSAHAFLISNTFISIIRESYAEKRKDCPLIGCLGMKISNAWVNLDGFSRFSTLEPKLRKQIAYERSVYFYQVLCGVFARWYVFICWFSFSQYSDQSDTSQRIMLRERAKIMETCARQKEFFLLEKCLCPFIFPGDSPCPVIFFAKKSVCPGIFPVKKSVYRFIQIESKTPFKSPIKDNDYAR